MKTGFLARRVHAEGCKGSSEPQPRADGKQMIKIGFPVSDPGILEEMAETYPIASCSLHVVQRGWESCLTGEPGKLELGLRVAPFSR